MDLVQLARFHMHNFFGFPLEVLAAWWKGFTAFRLARPDVAGDEQFFRGLGAFCLSIAIVAAIQYLVLRGSGWAVSPEDWLLLHVAPFLNFATLGALLLGLFRLVSVPVASKYVVTCILLVLCGLMSVLAIASVEQFSTGVQMFLERRDPAVSYVTAAIPVLWKSSATVELRVRLIAALVTQLAAMALYLLVWLPRVAATTMVRPHARNRLAVAAMIALGVHFFFLERITNQIQWRLIAAAVDSQ